MYTKSNAYVYCGLILIGCFICTGQDYAQAEPSSADFSNFPDNTVLITESVLKSNPSLSIYKWPSNEQVREREVKIEKASNVLKLYGHKRIKRVIKAESIPPDILDRFLTLRYHVKYSDRKKGCDALLARYKCDEYLVQSIVTSSYVRFVIRQEKPAARKTDDEKNKFVKEIIEKMFNNSDILLKTAFNITNANGGLEGKVKQPMPIVPNLSARWYETFSWWTDGEIVSIEVNYAAGSSGSGVDDQEWFARRLTRSGKRGLTQEMIDEVLEPKPSETIDIKSSENENSDAKWPIGLIAIIICSILALGGVFVLLRRK